MAAEEKIRWVERSEKADGSGRSYYAKTFSVEDGTTYTFCYFPDEDKAWFFDYINDHQSINFKCKTWEEADKLFAQLKLGQEDNSL